MHSKTLSSGAPRELGFAVRISALLATTALAIGLAACQGSNDPPFNSDLGDLGQLDTVPRDGGVKDVWQWIGDATVCGTISRVPELPPFDMLLALDTSYSMDFKEKWISVKSALKVFANDKSFSSMGVGVQYFPLRAQCKVSDYQVPDVAIASLPTIQQ